MQASDGDFYGTTFNTNPFGISQGRTIFRVTAAGQLTTLFTFTPGQTGNFSNGSSGASALNSQLALTSSASNRYSVR
jgi:hypothetical protein